MGINDLAILVSHLVQDVMYGSVAGTVVKTLRGRISDTCILPSMLLTTQHEFGCGIWNQLGHLGLSFLYQLLHKTALAYYIASMPGLDVDCSICSTKCSRQALSLYVILFQG